jgi:hypothetical protein
MGSLTVAFHHIFKNINLEQRLFEKFSINMMRSLICGTIAHEAYLNYNYIWLDKCLENDKVLNKFKNYHYYFLSYFVYDTILMFYQIYLKIEKNIRYDLLFHHILAITALLIIDYHKMYNITLFIGITEGMSLVSGPKLIAMHYGKKYITNLFIIYRLLYIIFIRMLFIWPTLIYFYNNITNECDKYKNQRNIYLVIFLVIIIFHAEIKWLHSGRQELTRI